MVGFLGVGSNLGDRRAHLLRGIGALAGAGIRPLAISSVWETEPVGCGPMPWFLNMAVKFDASHEPLRLLDALQRIEREAGRVRRGIVVPRTLDLDLLTFGDIVLDGSRLCLPHPRMWQRNFVLAPLAEIAPDLRNPATGTTVAEERARSGNDSAVIRLGPLAPARALPL